MYYVYILKGDTKHYVGYTKDLKMRWYQHLQGRTSTTKNMGSLSLYGYFPKDTKTEAIKLEKLIKKDGHIQHRLDHPTFIKVNEMAL